MNILTTTKKNDQMTLTKAEEKEKDQLQELIYSFLKEKAKSTQVVYEGHLKEFFSFLESFNINSVKKVRYSHLIAYREGLLEKELADNTINIKLATVKSFFSFLNMPMDSSGTCFIQNNVAQHLKKIKVDQYSHSQTFDTGLYQKIISDLKEDTLKGLRDKIILLIFGYCGLRKSEVKSMKVSSFYEQLGIPYYKVKGKGNKTIEKELPQNVYELIQKLITRMKLTENDYLFTNLSNSKNGNKQLSPSALNKIINNYAKKYGFKKTFRVHSLRSMSGIEVYRRTKDIQATQHHLNHANISTTQIYLNKVASKKVNYYGKMFTK